MVDKSTTRELGRALRRALSDLERAAKDWAIVSQCQSNLDWHDLEAVMVFIPIKRELEVDIWPLIRWIWETCPKIDVYAPRVRSESMEAVRMTPVTPTQSGLFGVPEPIGKNVLAPSGQIDVILTPLLGFDSSGQRVGYGKGYYDRFFSTRPNARRIGLGYAQMLVPDGIASSPEDVKLDSVITEAGLSNF